RTMKAPLAGTVNEPTGKNALPPKTAVLLPARDAPVPGSITSSMIALSREEVAANRSNRVNRSPGSPDDVNSSMSPTGEIVSPPTGSRTVYAAGTLSGARLMGTTRKSYRPTNGKDLPQVASAQNRKKPPPGSYTAIPTSPLAGTRNGPVNRSP